MEKEILSTDERIYKVNKIIDDYKKYKDTSSLRKLIHDLLDVYNDSVNLRNKETIMPEWVADFPDN